ncbi:hypothetical protein N0V90_003608 [Kalmusia sp. IMI 367209]|nr:hypothetical protein N0V90_003608 [Kalmusia sp. IMI 367209]
MPVPRIFRRKSSTPGKAEVKRADYLDDTYQWSPQSSENLIIVMGVTGAGKSYFVNQLKPNSVAEGHSLKSGVVDTPGFDDDEDSDAEILAKITRFLTAQYRLGICLKGIIYLYPITQNRFSGSARRFLETFRQLCGDHALSNVALVTTMWSKIEVNDGLRREVELQDAYWGDLISNGANVFQYNGTQGMAETIAGLLLSRDDVVLKIQQELSDDKCELNRTSAGSALASKLDKEIETRRKNIRDMKLRYDELRMTGDEVEVRRLERQLKAQREKQLRQLKARDELKAKIDEETEEKIQEVKSASQSRGEKWKTKRDKVRRLTSQKLEEISLHIPDPPEPAPQPQSNRLPRPSHIPRSNGHTLGDDTDSQSDDASGIYDSDALSERLSEESYENPFADKAEPAQQIEQLQALLRGVKEQLVEAKTQLALEQSKRPIEYDDQHFKVALDQLRYDVRQWCRTYFTHTGAYFTRSADRRFRGLTHNWAAYLCDKDWRPWLIQARVWDMLQCYVFDEYSKRQHYFLFTGPDKEYSVDKLFSQASRNGSQASRRAYREWRASTFTLLFPGKSSDIEPASYMEHVIHNRILKLRHILWRSLRPYAARNLSREEKNEAKSRLIDLIQSAIQLDLDIKKHTVDISLIFERPIYGAEFDPSRMEEALEHIGQGVVELIVSPPLYKETDLPNGRVERRLLKKPQVCTLYVRRPEQTSVEKAITKVYTRRRDGEYPQPPSSLTSMERYPSQDSRDSITRVRRLQRKPG